jgi:hypothetical protein
LKVSDLGETRLIDDQERAIPVPALNWCPPEVRSLFHEYQLFLQFSPKKINLGDISKRI